VAASGPHQFNFPMIFKVHKNSFTLKFENPKLPCFNHGETFREGRKDEGGQFSFWEKIQIETDFEFGCNFKGLQPYRKNSKNSPKFYLLKIFITVNLYWSTCIQKFDVPLQVAIRTKLNSQKGFNFNLKTP
jgi:hypothetical protein